MFKFSVISLPLTEMMSALPPLNWKELACRTSATPALEAQLSEVELGAATTTEVPDESNRISEQQGSAIGERVT